jgi:uncharacterized protein (DUF305 family)
MRRSVIAVIAAVAVVVVTVTAIVSFGVGRGFDDTDARDRGHGMMSYSLRHGGSAGGGLGYLPEMVAHHREAVAAAEQLRRSDQPRLRRFAESVIATQSAQMDQMERWLADWYPGRSTHATYRPMMRDLTGLSGHRLDRVFLQDMIRHHMAAVMMSQRLLARGLAEHPQVAALARSIRDEQHAEILRMSRWLNRGHPGGWRGHGGWMGHGGEMHSGGWLRHGRF